MKLQQIIEARYHVHPIIKFIDELIRKSKTRPDIFVEEVKIDKEDTQWAIEALTSKYGSPDEIDDDPEMPSYDWFVDLDGSTLEINVGCAISNLCKITLRFVR